MLAQTKEPEPLPRNNTMNQQLAYAEELRDINQLQQIVRTLNNKLSDAEKRYALLQENLMAQHERIATLEMERDDLLERTQRHIIDILFCCEDRREEWQEYYRKEFPNEIREYERLQASNNQSKFP